MASKSSTALSSILHRVTPSVYVSQAPPDGVNRSIANDSSDPFGKTKPPDIILLLSWSGANNAHVAKYIPSYQALFPTSKLIVITSAWTDFFFGNRPSQSSQLKVVIDAMATVPDATVLVHLFSNGGAHKLWRLSRAYKEAQGHLLPMNALILDSASGKVAFKRSAAAISHELPKPWIVRVPSLCLMYFLIGSLWLLEKVTGSKSIIDRVWYDLNRPDLINMKATRCYIFSRQDKMVWWKDVLDHGDEAEAKGSTVAREIFQSDHVAHMRLDRERYWRVVGNLWKTASGEDGL